MQDNKEAQEGHQQEKGRVNTTTLRESQPQRGLPAFSHLRSATHLFRGDLPLYFNPARYFATSTLFSRPASTSTTAGFSAPGELEMTNLQMVDLPPSQSHPFRRIHSRGNSASKIVPPTRNSSLPRDSDTNSIMSFNFLKEHSYLTGLIPLVPPPRSDSLANFEKAGATEDSGPSSVSIHFPELNSQATQKPQQKKGFSFWAIIITLCLASFLSALDLTSVSTALSTIAEDFNSPDSTWVGSSYALTSTACIPVTGSFAHIFGRRATTLGCLLFFLVGSTISGAAPSMNVLILGRSIQGVGGGGILTMTEILVVDLVPLAERGVYFGVFGITWAIASGIGPITGGSLASNGSWRSLFYLNIPISALAIVLTAVFMKVKTPKTTWKEKMSQLDFLNLLFIAATTSTILALTWGGETYSWNSPKVLVPLLLGLVGMALFFWLEKYARHPTVPFNILHHRTSLVGYVCTFLHAITVIGSVYYLPVYFQSCIGASAEKSGIDAFSLSFTVAPMAIIAGISVTLTQHYKWQNAAGWVVSIVGLGLMSSLVWNSSKVLWVLYPVIFGLGSGSLFTLTIFAVVAPIQPSLHPQAMSFHVFSRSFGQVVGITIGSTVLYNRLATSLPKSYLAEVGSAAGAFASIPGIKNLPEPLRTSVREAFATSLQELWKVLLGIGALGLVISLFMQNLTLATETDEQWGLEAEETEKGPLRQ